jgi:hypothetical protein
VSIWGQLRPADHTQPQYGVIQFAPAGSRSFQTLDVLQTLNPEGFFLIQVAIPSSGSVRLAWLSPGGVVYYSRSVAVS